VQISPANLLVAGQFVRPAPTVPTVQKQPAPDAAEFAPLNLKRLAKPTQANTSTTSASSPGPGLGLHVDLRV